MNDRHTADTINDDALDQLYADLDRYEEVVGELNEANTGLARKAARAEAALARVRTLATLWAKRTDQLKRGAELLHAALDHDPPGPAATEATEPHVYLSTGCHHGDHAYCQNMTGLNGAKRPGECKHCGARCICPCHTDQPKEQPMPTDKPTCTATITGPHVPGGGPIQCTREPEHSGNHVGSPAGEDGRTLWTDHNAGATPHRASSEEQR